MVKLAFVVLMFLLALFSFDHLQSAPTIKQYAQQVQPVLTPSATVAAPGPTQPTINDLVLSGQFPAIWNQSFIHIAIGTGSAPIGIAGDFNGDGAVTTADYAIFKTLLLKPVQVPTIYICFEHVITHVRDVRMLVLRRATTGLSLGYVAGAPASSFADCWP